MNKAIGDRMKDQYEDRTRYYLPRRTYTLIRVDGKAFSKFTKGLAKPFDDGFINAMNQTALNLCKSIQGAELAYVQSDEISVLLTDFDRTSTDAWFDGNIQKMVSVSASMATQAFNWNFEGEGKGTALFDSRVFIIPDKNEVHNYFVWRQMDAMRNSVSMCGQTLFSHKQLMKKSTESVKEMLLEVDFDWNSMDPGKKYGRWITKMKEGERIYCHVTNGPVLTENPEWLQSQIPVIQ